MRLKAARFLLVSSRPTTCRASGARRSNGPDERSRWRTRPRLLALLCALCAGGVPVARALPLAEIPQRGFVSTRPARGWEEGLISGNGTHGALVYGQPLHETIALNHARLYLPLNEPLPPVDTGSHLAEIRALMAEGQYQRASEYVVELSHQEGWGGKRWTDPLIPAFDLKIDMGASDTPADYARSVDFQTGVASVRWRGEQGIYRRWLFVSRSDDVVVLLITGPELGSVTCNLQLAQRPTEGQGGWWSEQIFREGIQDINVAAEGAWLTYRSRFRRRWPGSLRGYEGAARVVTRGGTAHTEGAVIHVERADEVLVLLRVAVREDRETSGLAELKGSLAELRPDFDALLTPHEKQHGGIFNRMRLDLGGGADRDLSSEELLAKSEVGRLNPALFEKQFDAARYAILSSSGASFPTLQGIWNGTWSPPWSSDFTLNGNVPCAIAANLRANMAECLLPYFAWMEAHVDEFRENARRLYGCRGIHVPSRASTHGLNNHFDATWPMTFWTAGAGWAAHFFYDYFLYTGDRDFLRERALPFMKEAALFYEDFLIEGPDGTYVFNPSYSPENNPGNNPSQACINATMDIAVARELLNNCIAACKTLQTDPDKVARWQAMLAKLPDYQISDDGAVKEWTTPLLTDNYQHRHCSHFYALFDGLPDEIAADTDLRRAFEVAADKRMAVRKRENGGVMAFGLVQLGLAASSLGNAEFAYDAVDWLANNFWRNNLVTTHDPGSLFNVDLCGGFPAVILKMLAESQPGCIDLLPALPERWPSGCVEGIRCRGQVEIEQLAWTPERIGVTLKSDVTQTITLRLPDGLPSRQVHLMEDQPQTLEIPRSVPSSQAQHDRVARVQEPLGFDAVGDLGGYVGQRIEANTEGYLKAFDIDQYVRMVEQKKHRDWWWIGEQPGKWLESAVRASRTDADEALEAKARQILSRLISAQEPSGYLGITDPAVRTQAQPVRGMDPYELYFMLHGLLTAAEEWNEPRALTTARKLADYFVEHIGPGKAEFWPSPIRPPDNRNTIICPQFTWVPEGTPKAPELYVRSEIAGHTAHYGWEGTLLINPMLRLYQATGDRRYRDWSEWVINNIDRWSGWDAFSRLDRVADGTLGVHQLQPYVHSHTFHMNFLGFLRMYQITGDASYLRKVRGAWQDVADRQMYVTGGVSVGEHYEPGYRRPLTGHVVETCANMSWMELTQYLLELTGEPHYGDAIERLLFNHVFASQTVDGDCYRYHTPPNGFKPDDYFHGPDCCTGSGHRIVAMLPRFIYAQGDNVVCVNQFVPSTARFEFDGTDVRVQQETRYPSDDTIRLHVDPERNASFSLHVRVPGWCAQPTAALNGKPLPEVESGTYLVLDRTWQSGDVVELTLPMHPRWIEHDRFEGDAPWALVRGPVVYALDTIWWDDGAASRPHDVGKAVTVVRTAGTPRERPATDDALGPFYEIEVRLAQGRKVTATMVPFTNIGRWYRPGELKPQRQSRAFSHALWLREDEVAESEQ